MKDISSNEKIHANKISQELQKFFDQNPGITLRSDDAYHILVTKNLVERDRHEGVKFREYLHKLKEANALVFIPQCRPEPGNGNRTNWIFQSASKQTIKVKNLGTEPKVPKIDEAKTEALKAVVQSFAKRNHNELDFIAMKTRETYHRAYEYWSVKEEELLVQASALTKDNFKLAEIFGRQPSVIENKLKELSK